MKIRGEGIEEQQYGLVPRMRFPEFKSNGPWELRSLGQDGEFLPSLVGKSSSDFGVGAARYIPYTNVFANAFIDSSDLRLVNVKESETQTKVRRGDVLFTTSSETPEEAGFSSIVLEDLADCYLNSFCTLFRYHPHRQPSLYFSGYLLRSSTIRNRLVERAQGSTRFNLSKRSFAELPVPYPCAHEQQKIAECLFSVDELIAAEGRKLNALRDHKKGLLQQLFPAEGETIPRLRFPGFRDAKEWGIKALGKLVVLQSGGTPSKASPKLWDGSIPWVSAKDMKRLFLDDTQDHISVTAVDCGARLVPAGTLLILTRGMTLLKDVPICVLRREMSFNQDVKALRPKTDLNGLFLALALLKSKQRLLRMVDIAGHGTGKLNTEDLQAFEFACPEIAEQQQIAACFSSLDDVIAAQLRKLDSLATYKKGLMQQLFPVLDEVQA